MNTVISICLWYSIMLRNFLEIVYIVSAVSHFSHCDIIGTKTLVILGFFFVILDGGLYVIIFLSTWSTLHNDRDLVGARLRSILQWHSEKGREDPMKSLRDDTKESRHNNNKLCPTAPNISERTKQGWPMWALDGSTDGKFFFSFSVTMSRSPTPSWRWVGPVVRICRGAYLWTAIEPFVFSPAVGFAVRPARSSSRSGLSSRRGTYI